MTKCKLTLRENIYRQILSTLVKPLCFNVNIVWLQELRQQNHRERLTGCLLKILWYFYISTISINGTRSIGEKGGGRCCYCLFLGVLHWIHVFVYILASNNLIKPSWRATPSTLSAHARGPENAVHTYCACAHLNFCRNYSKAEPPQICQSTPLYKKIKSNTQHSSCKQTTDTTSTTLSPTQVAHSFTPSPHLSTKHKRSQKQRATPYFKALTSFITHPFRFVRVYQVTSYTNACTSQFYLFLVTDVV